MAFVRPTLAGPQRQSDWMNKYAGAVGQLDAGRYQSANQNLAMSQLEEGRNARSIDARNAAWGNVANLLQSAHQQNLQQKQINQQRSAQRSSLAVQAGGMAATGAIGLGNLALGAGNLAVNQGQLALAQQMWGVVP